MDIIGNAEDLNVVMDMYNLLKCRDNFSVTYGSLVIYHKHGQNDAANENNPANNYRVNNKKTTTTMSFEYKTKTIRSTIVNNNTLEHKFLFS